MAVVFAFLAAFGFAMASVGQQRVASQVHTRHALRLGLLKNLISNWRWVAATLLDAGAFVFEAIALGLGSLVLVQAILPSSLLFGLPVAARLMGRRMSRKEWLAAVAVAGGIVVFLVTASPSGGKSQATGAAWLVLGGIIVVSVATLVAVGASASSVAVKSGCWVAGGALSYALLAAVTKSTVDLLGDGIGAVFSSWQPYVLVLSAGTGTLLVQSAFQTGSLSTSMPLIAMTEPVAGTLIGSIVFAENLRHDPIHIVVMVAALLTMFAGVVTLSRSPLARYIS